MLTVGTVRAATIVGAVSAITFAAIFAGPTPTQLVMLLAIVIAGTYIGLAHPTWLLWTLAAVIACLPAGYVPGVHLPLIFAMTSAVLLATVIHPPAGPSPARSSTAGSSVARYRSSLQPLDRLLILFALIAIPSVVLTMTGLADIVEYAKWATAVLLIVALRRLTGSQLATFGRVFVGATAVSGLIGLVMLTVDSGGKTFSLLSPFGYTPASAGRFVYTGATAIPRLSGTFIDPNAAGIGLLAALMICPLVFRGRTRWLLGLFLLVCIAGTLSRAALFSVVLGVILMLLFHTMTGRARGYIAGSMVAGMVVLAAVPASRHRIFSSFGSGDTGSSARGDALRDYPANMAGHWLLGHGWGIPEFKDPSLAFTINYVANAPLLAIYRGGLFVGVAFTVVMLYCCWLAYRCLRHTRWEPAFFGGCFIGFFVLGMQLDFSTVTIPVSVTDLSVMIAFLVFAQRFSASDEPASAHATVRPAPVGAG
ncbi:O-antigen ligase domain-containing protein [Gordonia polyisoprenivorans]|nr:O-antigen ligase domain-containing protein [Gordonia polyisoprenivorans]